jgi:hypothetical protein
MVPAVHAIVWLMLVGLTGQTDILTTQSACLASGMYMHFMRSSCGTVVMCRPLDICTCPDYSVSTARRKTIYAPSTCCNTAAALTDEY